MSVIDAPVNTPEGWTSRARAERDPWGASGWTLEGESARHARVIAALDPQPGESLLDWGCGPGRLAWRLSEDVTYVGYDSALGMVERARTEVPWLEFTVHQPSTAFDLVACIGPFNLPEGWSKEHTWHTIRHLWDTTGCRAIAVSLYAGYDPNCLSYTTDEALRCGRDLGHGSLVERIRHNDLLLVSRR